MQVQSGSIWYNYSMTVLFNPRLYMRLKDPKIVLVDPLFLHPGGLSLGDESDGGRPHFRVGKNSIAQGEYRTITSGLSQERVPAEGDSRDEGLHAVPPNLPSGC